MSPRIGIADPNHRKRSSFYIIDEGETDDGEQGLWVVDEAGNGLQIPTQNPNSGSWALRVLTPSACTADHSRKEDQMVFARQANVQDPASARRQKEKAVQHGNKTRKTQLSGGKGQGKKGKKGITGPDNPTSQLPPKMSNTCCSGTGKEGKTKEVVEDREVKKVCEELRVTKLYVKDGVCESCV